MLTNPMVFIIEVRNIKGEVLFSTVAEVGIDHTVKTNGVAVARPVREALVGAADLSEVLDKDFFEPEQENRDGHQQQKTA